MVRERRYIRVLLVGRPAQAEAWQLKRACWCGGLEGSSLAGAEAILSGVVEYDVLQVEMQLESQTDISRLDTAIHREPWKALERGSAKVKC